MAFFDKIRLTLSSPLRQQPDNQPIKTWSIFSDGVPPSFAEDSIRLLLYRECDRRGRKVLYDSSNVIRDKSGKFSYIPPSSDSTEFRDLSEWIFGCVPLSSSSTKRFHRFNGNYLWSQVFQNRRRSRNPSIGSSSLSSGSTCELSSSGYLSGSGIEDSSYENRLQNASIDSVNSDNSLTIKIITNHWSFPNMGRHSRDGGGGGGGGRDEVEGGGGGAKKEFKTCHSLPSKFEGGCGGGGGGSSSSLTSSTEYSRSSSGRTFLALAILITPPSSTNSHNCDNFGSYLTANSWALESACDWFNSASSTAYSTPSNFVQTIYTFATSLRASLFSRLIAPLISLPDLTPTWRILTTSSTSTTSPNPLPIGQFLTNLLASDLGWTRRKIYKERAWARIVLVGSGRKLAEIKSILYLLKLILFRCPFCASKQSNLTSFEVIQCQNSEEMTPKSEEIGIECLKLNPEDFQRSRIDDRLISKESRDSGIDSMHSGIDSCHSGIDSLTSGRNSFSSGAMKRSTSSSKGFSFNFSSDFEDSDENFDSKGPKVFNFDQKGSKIVNFHLGDDVECEQSFSKLSLSEPNPDKLKKVTIPSPSYMEEVSGTSRTEDLDLETSNPPPKEIDLEFNEPKTKKLSSFCPYCDSIGIGDKFSPFWYCQWVRGSGGGGVDLARDDLEYIKSSGSPWIIFNIEKGTSMSYNCPSNAPGGSSPLIESLLEQLRILISNGRDGGEIEEAITIQLDFLRRLGEDFGGILDGILASGSLEEFDLGRILEKLSPARRGDLPILFSVAKKRYPKIEGAIDLVLFK